MPTLKRGRVLGYPYSSAASYYSTGLDGIIDVTYGAIICGLAAATGIGGLAATAVGFLPAFMSSWASKSISATFAEAGSSVNTAGFLGGARYLFSSAPAATAVPQAG